MPLFLAVPETIGGEPAGGGGGAAMSLLFTTSPPPLSIDLLFSGCFPPAFFLFIWEVPFNADKVSAILIR